MNDQGSRSYQIVRAILVLLLGATLPATWSCDASGAMNPPRNSGVEARLPSPGKWTGGVEQMTEQPDRIAVSFKQLSAVYFLYRNHPAFDTYRSLLKRSLKEKCSVRFDYDVEGQRITYVGIDP